MQLEPPRPVSYRSVRARHQGNLDANLTCGIDNPENGEFWHTVEIAAASIPRHRDACANALVARFSKDVGHCLSSLCRETSVPRRRTGAVGAISRFGSRWCLIRACSLAHI